jgi:1-acyl-sn-glycerol-3-phosphate acyltransferase
MHSVSAPDYPLADAWRETRRVLRVGSVLLHIGTGFVLAVATGALLRPHAPLPRRATHWWLARLTRILGLDIVVAGTPPDRAALWVSNHVSWLDIPVLGAVTPMHFLSKAEVAGWPLIGRLATAGGTLYIRRGHGQVHQRAKDIAAHIDAGRAIVVFPEGTTTDGSAVRSFHPPLFRVATDEGRPLQPVVIRYPHDGGGSHPAAPFIGDDEFHVHLWRLLREDRVRVEVTLLPLRVPGRDAPACPRELADQVRAEVGVQLGAQLAGR